MTTNKISLNFSGEGCYGIIWIVGPNKFTNELLAGYLENQEGWDCCRCHGEAALGQDESAALKICLELIDASEISHGQEWHELVPDYRGCGSKNRLRALFNVRQDGNIAEEAIRQDIQGIFYSKDLPENVCKGIEKIFQGEIWYSREVLLNYVLLRQTDDALPVSRPQKGRRGHLTFRERTIIQHLTKGATNQEIADEMLVSVHTVKSHLYKLYKKIEVPNRFQAVVWAASNLD